VSYLLAGGQVNEVLLRLLGHLTKENWRSPAAPCNVQGTCIGIKRVKSFYRQVLGRDGRLVGC